MVEHDAAEYGSFIADDYDAIYGNAFDTQAAVDRLADLADGGPVLELGVGTGRLALPLVERNLTVHGIDGSEQMLELLGQKPGGERISTTAGDFSTVRLEPPAEFSLVVLAVNTIFALEDQEAQCRCFATAAYHLRPNGRFVVEAWVPERLPAGQSLRPRQAVARLHRARGRRPRSFDPDARHDPDRARWRRSACACFRWSTATRGRRNSTSWLVWPA